MQEQLLGNASLNIPDLVSEDFFISNKNPGCFPTPGDPHKRNWFSGSTSHPGVQVEVAVEVLQHSSKHYRRAI